MKPLTPLQGGDYMILIYRIASSSALDLLVVLAL